MVNLHCNGSSGQRKEVQNRFGFPVLTRKFNISAATFFNQVSRMAGQQTDRSRVLSVAGNISDWRISTVALER